MKRLFLLAVVLVLFGPAVVAAQESDDALLTVSGTATVQVRPDEAVVRLGIQNEARDASEAQLGANRVATAILQALGELSVASEAVQTSRVQLHPIYDSRRQASPQNNEPYIVGYRATNSIAVTLRDLEKIGPVIDRSVGAGANRIESVDLRLKDDAEARRTALSAAVRDARSKAETIAATLGEELGRIVEVNEGGVSAPPITYRETAMSRASADVGTPVATGTLSVRASVTLRYRLAPSG